MNSNHFFRSFIVLALGFAGQSLATGAKPVVREVVPPGVRCGETATLRFVGVRLGDARDAICDTGAIEIVEVKVVDNKRVDVTVRTPADLPPGRHPIRLVTKTGIANLRLIGVGAMPIVDEAEPNHPGLPQSIPLNRTVHGSITADDIDSFEVEVPGGQTLTVEIEAIRLFYSTRDRNIFDPVVSIHDGSREVARCDDSALLAQDSFCSHTPETTRQLRVDVGHASMGGHPSNRYRLHVGTFPRPVAVVPGGASPGETLTLEALGADRQPVTMEVEIPVDASETYEVVAENDHGPAPSSNRIRVSELDRHHEAESNNDLNRPESVSIPIAIEGAIEADGDQDCFEFEVKKGQPWRVTCFARSVLRSPLDAVIDVFEVVDGKNKYVTRSDDISGRFDPQLTFTPKRDGLCRLRIRDHRNVGDPLRIYRLEIERQDPRIRLSLKDRDRDTPETVVIPIGGQMGAVVRAARDRFGEKIDFEFEDLPAGVTARTFPIPRGRNEIGVLFEASSDAQPQASLVRIAGADSMPDDRVTSSQTHVLVRGRNRRGMLEYSTRRYAVATGEPAPFRIKLDQPATPVVRGGGKNLSVTIQRDEGFEGPVYLRTLYNPPGLSVNNSRRISKGKSQASIPITANKRAAIGQWPLILIASYDTKLGRAEIATPAIAMDIEDSLFDFKIRTGSVTRGEEAEVWVEVSARRELAGPASVELVGLPAGVDSPSPRLDFNGEPTTLKFPIRAAADARLGQHRTLACVARVEVDDETITQTHRPGTLRVDDPLPIAKLIDN